jgi:hypothetical protein
MEKDSGIHVELGDDAKYAVKGEGTILFQLESSGLLEAQDVLYVPVTEDEEQELRRENNVRGSLGRTM